jgi:thiol-disulfide isomerase/thioredoxin
LSITFPHFLQRNLMDCCPPCATAHKQLDELIGKYPDKVSVQIRLLCNSANAEDKKTIAAKAIFQKTKVLRSNQELQNMLSDWFEWMDFEKWNAKWNGNKEIEVANTLVKHEQWNKETGITYTPTLFLNGRKLPGRYSIKNIKKMLPQLEDAFAVVK